MNAHSQIKADKWTDKDQKRFDVLSRKINHLKASVAEQRRYLDLKDKRRRAKKAECEA